jgi:hypothetical protein
MFYIVAGLLCLLLLTAAALYRLNHHRTFYERVFHGPLTVSAEWAVVSAEPPLRREREKQLLVIGLAEPYFSGLSDWGVRVPDGTLVMPQVELIEGDGKAHALSFAGSFGRQKPFYESNDLPTGAEFVKVRIRCDSKVELNLLAWTTYNPKDLR